MQSFSAKQNSVRSVSLSASMAGNAIRWIRVKWLIVLLMLAVRTPMVVRVRVCVLWPCLFTVYGLANDCFALSRNIQCK